ncbi:putative bifunctional diguanylate cyclase/phosphodiesterase [Nocardioides sp. Iso805N]|uniref:putative bifunctional diguanylate cyclase/phosphodiesterase n=1 Tax=Nocardioides sp. Iso805N TaxID=1283287 RepID=UPI0003828B44|nr:bifunctional diguanylate cyclase/phosphodiesterase [Nocardioides sp. Iso805N]
MSPARTGELLRSRLVRARGVPTVATDEVLARTTGILYLTCGLLVLAATLRSQSWSGANIDGIRIIALVAALLGPVVVYAGHRLPRPLYHVLVAIGTAIVTLLVLFGNGGEASVALAVPYIYVIIDASFFFGGLGMAFHVALVMVASTVAMTAVGLPLADLLMVQGFFLVVSVIIAWLARIADLAEHDSLTGLVNRRGFDRRLDQELARPRRERGELALVLLDVDDFKTLNDNLGKRAGDQVLASCAGTWDRVLLGHQTLSRYGGDEFAVLLPGSSLGKAADIADRLRALAPDGVGMSAGVAAWTAGDTPSILFGRAEVALYDAKSAGRGQTVVYGDPTRGASELEAAVAADELLLHFQPVIRLRDNAVVSAEALVRWNHPQRGLVPPNDFIPQAERTGAIHALGRWTLAQACAAAVASSDRRGIGVNVSVPELRGSGYVDQVHQVLSITGLSPERLVLEVTEALFDEDDPQVVRTLQGLRALGVRVAIDDFGTGYSSLRWLEQFPVDTVKIDRSFVAAIDPDRGRQPVLSAIIAISRSLGMTTVAEGVETPEQAIILRELGCDYAQGYLFGRPVPLEQLPRESTAPVG